MATESSIGLGGFSLSKDEIATTGFDHFAPQEVETGIKNKIRQKFKPITSTGHMGPFKFDIPANPTYHTDSESIRLHGAMRIIKHDNGNVVPLPEKAPVTTVNNVFQSLWKSINVSLNGTPIKDPGQNSYAFKAYLETHLSYSKSVKDVILPSRGYYYDTPGKFDSLPSLTGSTLTESLNAGATKRRKLFAKSKWVYFVIYLHVDSASMKKYIPPAVKTEIEFHRNPDEFVLKYSGARGQYGIELKDLELSLKRYKDSPKVQKWYNEKVQSGLHPTIPIDRAFVTEYTVPSGTLNLGHNNIITGVLPEQVVIGIQKESAASGDNEKNPFNFTDHKLQECYLKVNGVKEPEEGYKLNVDSGDTANFYSDFLENCGVANEDREFGISEEDYYGGSFLIAFDRTIDGCNRYHRHEPETGAIDIVMTSSEATAETLTIKLYCSYSSDIVFARKKDDPKVVKVISYF